MNINLISNSTGGLTQLEKVQVRKAASTYFHFHLNISLISLYFLLYQNINSTNFLISYIYFTRPTKTVLSTITAFIENEPTLTVDASTTSGTSRWRARTGTIRIAPTYPVD